MANENIVGSLFGLTPEAAEEAWRARQEERAQNWSSKDAQGKFGLIAGRAAESFSNDIPRLFGHVPPELKKATDIQGAMMEVRDSGIDMNDPTTLYPAVIQALQKRGLTQEAFLVAQEGSARIAAANKAALENDELRAKVAKTTNEADPIFKLYQDGKLDPATWEQYQNGQLAAKDLILLAKPNHEITEIGEGGLRIKAIVDKTTGDTIRKLGDPYSPITSQTTVNTSVKSFEPVLKFREKHDDEVKKINEVLEVMRSADNTIEKARIDGNAKAAEAAIVQVVEAVGGGSRAQAELDRMASANSIPRKIADMFSTFYSGTPTNFTMNQYQELNNALRKIPQETKTYINKQYETMLREKGFGESEINFVTGQTAGEADPRSVPKKDGGWTQVAPGVQVRKKGQ